MRCLELSVRCRRNLAEIVEIDEDDVEVRDGAFKINSLETKSYFLKATPQ